MKWLFALLITIGLPQVGEAVAAEKLRLGIVGLTHDHVHGVLRRHADGEVQIVGIVEPNRQLIQRHAKKYGFKMDYVFDSIEEMLDETDPDVVSDYGSIYQHLSTVQACAPRKIHVMVEKPLAVNLAHARKMQTLVREYGILVLTNFETTWYPSHHHAKRMLSAPSFGGIRKIVVHDGHPGPVEIGCSNEFLKWLTDPELNGAGALTDFGCYGANLTTWLMNGADPISVTAVTQQIKPDVYPHVDDEATIVLTYPKSQAIIQASWNWDYNRKDIEIYCVKGHVHCLNNSQMQIRIGGDDKDTLVFADKLPTVQSDPYKYLASVIRGEQNIAPTDLSAFENNVTVMEILEAAKLSAKEGRTVLMAEFLEK